MNRQIHFEKFIDSHPVFTTEESSAFLARHNAGEWHNAILKDYEKVGRVIHIRDTLYGSIPWEDIAAEYPCSINPEQILITLAPDLVMSHYAACSFLGIAYDVFNSYMSFYSETPMESFDFQGTLFEQRPYPQKVIEKKKKFFNTKRYKDSPRFTCIVIENCIV